MARAGADAVVSPGFKGGLRMASEMIRPTVVSFLDMMLRDREKNLRVEEIAVPNQFVGRSISTLDLMGYPQTLLLAVKAQESWIYNPPDSHVIRPDDTLVFMTTPEGRGELERLFIPVHDSIYSHYCHKTWASFLLRCKARLPGRPSHGRRDR